METKERHNKKEFDVKLCVLNTVIWLWWGELDYISEVDKEIGDDGDVVVEKNNEDPMDGKKDEWRSVRDGGREERNDEACEREKADVFGNVMGRLGPENMNITGMVEGGRGIMHGWRGEADTRRNDMWAVQQSYKGQRKIKVHGCQCQGGYGTAVR